MKLLKGNKGEWSELYVFIKLLCDGKLYQSDINLNFRSDNYYEVIKVYREDNLKNHVYERGRNIEIYLVKNETKNFIGELDLNELKIISKDIYEGIVNAKGKSFNISAANDFIQKANIKKLSAKVTSKSDIKVRIYDHRLAKETDLGFSIKSLIGQNSTLFNTGPGNNFIFKVIIDKEINVENFNSETYKPKGKLSKITCRLDRLQNEYSAKIQFVGVQSKQLWKNLKMIDGDLPEIIAQTLLHRWIEKNNIISDIINKLEIKDPLNFYDENGTEQKMYRYKIQKFLAECALGMTSETVWNGVYDATGGVIICKRNGDIVCFHIYDFNLLRDYLLNNTIIEQPSTGEDEQNPGNIREGAKKYYWGWLYREKDELYFKINLQVRFN